MAMSKEGTWHHSCDMADIILPGYFVLSATPATEKMTEVVGDML